MNATASIIDDRTLSFRHTFDYQRYSNIFADSLLFATYLALNTHILFICNAVLMACLSASRFLNLFICCIRFYCRASQSIHCLLLHTHLDPLLIFYCALLACFTFFNVTMYVVAYVYLFINWCTHCLTAVIGNNCIWIASYNLLVCSL